MFKKKNVNVTFEMQWPTTVNEYYIVIVNMEKVKGRTSTYLRKLHISKLDLMHIVQYTQFYIINKKQSHSDQSDLTWHAAHARNYLCFLA